MNVSTQFKSSKAYFSLRSVHFYTGGRVRRVKMRVIGQQTRRMDCGSDAVGALSHLLLLFFFNWVVLYFRSPCVRKANSSRRDARGARRR